MRSVDTNVKEYPSSPSPAANPEQIGYPPPMPQLIAATCTRCGAPLRLDPSAPKQVCTFCGNEHIYTPAHPQQPPQRFPQPPFPHPPPPSIHPQPTPLVPSAIAGVAFAITVALFGVGIVVAVVAAVSGRGHGNSSASPGGGGVVPPGERLQWSSNGTRVMPARIDGDSVEDFVGRYVLLETGGTSTQTLFVGGFSGATLARAWKAGPVSSRGAKLRSPRRAPTLQTALRSSTLECWYSRSAPSA